MYLYDTLKSSFGKVQHGVVNSDSITVKNIIRDVGGVLETAVSTDGYENIGCYLDTPQGTIEFWPNNNSTERYVLRDGVKAVSNCSVDVMKLTKNDTGRWKLYFTVEGEEKKSQIYQLTVNDDPENPIIDENRGVDILDTQFFNVTIGTSHEIVIEDHPLNTKESCHIRTPKGLQYTIMEGFHIPGIEVLEADPNMACGIIVNVKNEELIGEWVLIARIVRLFDPVEIRLPFTIYVEEVVQAAHQEVTITEGTDLYLRLQKPTELSDSCKLYGPRDNLTNVERDKNYNDTCGYVVKNIQQFDSGKWEIRYGIGIKYRAYTEVTVIAAWNKTTADLEFVFDRSVEVVIGPDNAIYCKVEDPSEDIIFEGSGNCTIVLEKAMEHHNGNWTMTVGFPGKVVTEEYFFKVRVIEAEPKATVTTFVEMQQEEVMLKCSVPTEYEVKACNFRKPSGRVVFASPGVGESHYTFYGVGTSMESKPRIHDCGLKISNPETFEDFGMWRCAIETTNDTYYGFLRVYPYPEVKEHPEVSAYIISEPTLVTVPNYRTIEAVEGDTVTMSCSIDSDIQYCFFRSPNGTIFSVTSGTTSENWEYVGAGLDAGECGVAFKNLLASDSGTWSCQVGLHDQPEQTTNISVYIHEAIVAYQTNDPNTVMVHAEVYLKRPLDYCRFVRSDGFGFSSSNLPANYNTYNSLDNLMLTRYCSLHIRKPTILDQQPWTVFGRIRGLSTEIQGRSKILRSESPVAVKSYTLWIMSLCLISILFTLALMLIPENNRRRSIRVAAFVRNSFRKSFQKKLLSDSSTAVTTPSS
ncbi:uncharacterized protein LOC131846571 [Achroia grisella]|uniref:uncharacterized protein LOC131846571 n=1 Tax=Achroia grisella TaxID=688607 RepID=UPI0027D2AFE5|nr:uncharacterized protein LOC131846571 [Achroia grisella]